MRDTADVTGLVGSGAAARVYPILAPRGAALEYITYERIGSEWERHTGGPSAMGMATVQVTSWGATYAEAQTLSEAVRVTLEKLEGSIGASGEEIAVYYTYFRSGRNVFDKADDGSDALIYGMEQDYDVRHAMPLTV